MGTKTASPPLILCFYLLQMFDNYAMDSRTIVNDVNIITWLANEPQELT